MGQPKDGDKVRVSYTGHLTDGTVFDSSVQRGPLEFTIGRSNIIPGFVDAVRHMSVGQTMTTVVPFDKAYGPHLVDLVQRVDREFMADAEPIRIGQQFTMGEADAPSIVVSITEIGDDYVVLDGNHPLAGKELVFEIELVDVQEA